MVEEHEGGHTTVSDVDPEVRAIIDRIGAVGRSAPIDKARAEQAMTAHLRALGLDPLPVLWIDDPRAASQTGASAPSGEWATALAEGARQASAATVTAGMLGQLGLALVAPVAAFAGVLAVYVISLGLFHGRTTFSDVAVFFVAVSAASAAYKAVASRGVIASEVGAEQAARAAAVAAQAWDSEWRTGARSRQQKSVEEVRRLHPDWTAVRIFQAAEGDSDPGTMGTARAAHDVAQARVRLEARPGEVDRLVAEAPISPALSSVLAASLTAARSDLGQRKSADDLLPIDRMIEATAPWIDAYEAGVWLCWVTPEALIAVGRPEPSEGGS